jgi:hypothetical protein
MGALVLAFAVFSCGAGGQQRLTREAGEQVPTPSQERRADGPLHENRLARESSPYLLLHAHNPVDWYPWGEEALAKARAEGKPIFLSIGYSTCFWCHVMERDIFSKPEIAALMNQWFVSVKVDREERPDLDEVYMTATQLMTHGGGWPNSLFLTPELAPFFAGTYFPPADRDGMPGFPSVLTQIHQAWIDRHADVEAQAGRVTAAMAQVLATREAPATAVPAPSAAAKAVAQLAADYDRKWGGFGEAPKFPSPGNLFLLWQAGKPGGEEHRMVADTLRAMGRGGIYDQLAGGFHRYSTDERWLVPHFEKMLYDNALLAEIAAIAWQESHDPDLARLAQGTLDFVLRDMTLPDGGFESAIDAETAGVEGAYYVWTLPELRHLLGEQGFALLAPIYGFDGDPSMEGGRYVLHLTAPLDEQARRLGIRREELLARLEPHLDRLRGARRERPMPLVDDKVLTDWNGMAIAALARAGRILDEPRYLAAARRAMDFLLARLDAAPGPLRHVWRGDQGKLDAFVDDYAFLVRGLLALHEATAEPRWPAAASGLADELERRLAAPQGGYFLAASRPGLLFQPLSVTDGAIPAGNAVAIHDLLTLANLTGEPRFRERAERNLRAFARELEQYPRAVPTLAAAVLRAGQERAPPNGRPAVRAASTPEKAPADSLDPLAALAHRVVRAEVEVAAAGADEWRPFAVHLRIDRGWHVNANPASGELLIPTRVEGAVRGLRYPAAKRVQLAFADAPLAVYEGQAVVRGEAAPGAGEVSLVYQACDDQRCLPPVTERLSFGAPGPE